MYFYFPSAFFIHNQVTEDDNCAVKKRPQMLGIICKTNILLKLDFSLPRYIPIITAHSLN